MGVFEGRDLKSFLISSAAGLVVALTTVLLISAVATVVNAITLATDPKTYTVILAAERSVGGTLEFHCTGKTETNGQREMGMKCTWLLWLR